MREGATKGFGSVVFGLFECVSHDGELLRAFTCLRGRARTVSEVHKDFGWPK